MQQYGSKYFARRTPTTPPLPALRVGPIGQNSTFTKDGHVVYRPLAGYGLPPPRGEFSKPYYSKSTMSCERFATC